MELIFGNGTNSTYLEKCAVINFQRSAAKQIRRVICSYKKEENYLKISSSNVSRSLHVAILEYAHNSFADGGFSIFPNSIKYFRYSIFTVPYPNHPPVYVRKFIGFGPNISVSISLEIKDESKSNVTNVAI